MTATVARNLAGEMANVLAALEMLPHGTIANWSPTTRSPFGTRLPTGELYPPHEHWRKLWREAAVNDERGESEKHRQAALEGARDELDRWQHGAPPVVVVEETQAELEARIVKEGDGWPIEQVALHFKCSVTMVRKARANAMRVLVEATARLERSERAERVRQMRAEGMSLRQIAMVLKCDAATVHRDLLIPSP